MVWLFLILFFGVTQCSEILVVAPFQARSHYFLLEPLARELGERGHQVTFLTAIKGKSPTKNVKEIFVEAEMSAISGMEDKNFFEFRHMGPIASELFIPTMGTAVSDLFLSDSQVKDILNSGKKYDVIVGEAFLTESLIGGLSYKLKAPLVGYATFMPSLWVNYMGPSCFKAIAMMWLVLILFFGVTQCSEILVVAPFQAPSHYFLLEPLARELGERGHQVTFLTAIKGKTAIKNVKEIFVEADMSVISGMKDNNFFKYRHMGPIAYELSIPFMGSYVSEIFLSNSQVKDILNSGKKYDVIIGQAFLTECLLGGLSYKLNAPLVGYATFMPSFWFNYMVGNDAPTSYITEPLTMLTKSLNFENRLYNFLYGLFGDVYHLGYYLYKQDQLFRKHFGPDVPYLKDIMKNTSILLVNDHVAFSFPRPTAANLISIGGLHIKPPKPLPSDLQKYMDKSENGVILFSMGSNLRSSQMDPRIIELILKTFGRLKENILWKFETDLPNKPKNVYISDWLPQSDILAHPKLKLFITHGGGLSTAESIDRGVPVVGIPIFGDQPLNMRQSENAGVGISLKYDDLTEELFYNTITEVLTNPKYTEAAKTRSKIFRDNPQPPLDRAVFWVEYVIRHNGAKHLRSAAQDLLWFQYYQLDVMAVIFIAFYISFKLLVCTTKKLCSLVCKKNQNPKNKRD